MDKFERRRLIIEEQARFIELIHATRQQHTQPTEQKLLPAPKDTDDGWNQAPKVQE
jgi:hypothetical protein